MKYAMKYTKQSMLRVLLISTFMLIGSGGVMATEEAKYQVNYQQENFQVRQYEAHIVAETIVDSEFEDAGSEAFQRLFKYISGKIM